MFKYFKPAIYLAVLVVPLLFLLLRPKSVSTMAVLDAGSKPIGLVQGFAFEIKKLLYYHDTYDEYRSLKKQTDLLKAKVISQQEELKEAKRLVQISDFRRAQTFPSVVARVIGRDPSNWDASLVLDKGKLDGIRVGMPVVSPLGVVGKVLEVGHTTSKAMLVADPDFSVAAVVSRSRESGLLTGTLQGICRLLYLTENADVKVGDVVVTSSLSSAFPQGLLIGRITDVQASVNSHTVECLVDPSVDLSQIEEVVIIKK